MTYNARQPSFAIVGNWDIRKQTGAGGFGVLRYDPTTGVLAALATVAPQITVGAACLNSRRDVLYCTDEHTTLPGYYAGGGGQVFAFAMGPNGEMTEIGRRPSLGTLPSSLAIDPHDRFLVVTHHTDRVPATRIARSDDGRYSIDLVYDDATTVLFPLAADGAIGDALDVYLHMGDGGPLARQTHPQLHSVTRSPTGQIYVVCDKGNDEVVSFAIDETAGKLRRLGSFASLPGSSPRYAAFHPSRPFLFVNHETAPVVAALRVDEVGTLELIGQIDVPPLDWSDGPAAKQSDIAVHPSGRWLYTLAREIDALFVFAIDEATGRLARIQSLRLEVEGPRAMGIAPDGRFLLIAGLDSHDVHVFEIHDDGTVTATGVSCAQPNPGTITFV